MNARGAASCLAPALVFALCLGHKLKPAQRVRIIVNHHGRDVHPLRLPAHPVNSHRLFFPGGLLLFDLLAELQRARVCKRRGVAAWGTWTSLR